jgi:putative SOS response-associated peptidase YedK
MCGKFSQMYSWREIVDFSQPLTSELGDEQEIVTPMRVATVLHLDEARDRRTTRMRWGWSIPGTIGKHERPDHIHARAETIDTRPTFREAFLYRRGVLVVRTFNEGEELPNGKTKLRDLTEPLAAAGFVIERIGEPTPSEALQARDPEGFEQLSRLPAFIFFRARKLMA